MKTSGARHGGSLGAGAVWWPSRGAVAGRANGRFERVAEYLGLTEEQQAVWKSLQEQHRAEMEPLRQEGRELHERLRRPPRPRTPIPRPSGRRPWPSSSTARRSRAAHEALTEKLTGTLTPEQKAKFDAFKASHRGGYGKRGMHKGGRGPRPGGARRSPRGRGSGRSRSRADRRQRPDIGPDRAALLARAAARSLRQRNGREPRLEQEARRRRAAAAA